MTLTLYVERGGRGGGGGEGREGGGLGDVCEHTVKHIKCVLSLRLHHLGKKHTNGQYTYHSTHTSQSVRTDWVYSEDWQQVTR